MHEEGVRRRVSGAGWGTRPGISQHSPIHYLPEALSGNALASPTTRASVQSVGLPGTHFHPGTCRGGTDDHAASGPIASDVRVLGPPGSLRTSAVRAPA